MKEIKHLWKQALTASVALMILCGLGFPLLLTVLAQLLFPHQAAGSPMIENGTVIGSEFVGQEFTQPYFLKGRPSAVHYNTYFETAEGSKVYADGTPFSGLASGSQNLGPSNPALRQRVEEDLAAFLEENPSIRPDEIPADLLTASGSGLDPHISPQAAAVQLPEIARASGLSMEQLEQIVQDHTSGKLLGLFGAETVHVLGCNRDIARAMAMQNP